MKRRLLRRLEAFDSFTLTRPRNDCRRGPGREGRRGRGRRID